MREVEGLALGKLGLDSGPCFGLGSVREKVHDDGTLGDGLVKSEKIGARDPAILDGVIP